MNFCKEKSKSPSTFMTSPCRESAPEFVHMPMAIVILSLALAAGPTTKTDAAALVAQLGSSTPAEQAAAAESLKALGRNALRRCKMP